MSTTSTLHEHLKPPVLKYAKDLTVHEDSKAPEKYRKRKELLTRAYREIIETNKSMLLIAALLAVYNITGLHDWWIQFVGKLV